MKQLLFAFFSVISISLAAQQEFTTTGKIIDSATGQPLPGASVFCQNTTIGTISKADGVFTLILPLGGYDLIISYTGYETQSVRINSTTTTISVALKQKDKSLQEVAVVGSNEVPDGLAKYGQFFNTNFLGNDSNAVQTKIQNPEALQFYFSKKRNRLKVKAKEDLIIVNELLGYRIRFQLDSFAHDYSTGISVYTGFPFFEALDTAADKQAQWKANRLKAYKGSRLHFIRSWYAKTLEAEGFKVEKVDTLVPSLKTSAIDNPYDSTIYQVVENNDVEISFNGKMRIVYKNALPDLQYLKENNLPVYLRARVSILDIDEGFVIQQNGYFYDQNDVTNIGYWSWQKLGDALPYDYKP